MSLMGPSKPLQGLDTNQLGYSGVDAVNLDYIFGSITAHVPAESNPDDIPNTVFSNEFITEYTLTANALGGAAFVLKPENLVSTGTNANDRYIAVNIDPLFNPTTGAGGTFTGFASPLATAGALLFTRVKSLGIELEIIPTTSALNSKGNYVTVFSTTELGSTAYPGTLTLSYAAISRIPYARIIDMRTAASSRSFESTVYRDMATANANPENVFVLVMQACEPSASVLLRVTQKYQAQVADGGLSVVRGKIPRMGNFTSKFKDFLRVNYPDIIHWPSGEVRDLYRQLKTVPPDYSALVAKCQTLN